jgi:hypothetical protein
MVYKFKQYIHDVKTLDENYVDLFIQAKSIIDDTLISEMKKHVLSNANMTLALETANSQNAKINLVDGAQQNREFYVAFLLHYDIELKIVRDAKIFSFIEK